MRTQLWILALLTAVLSGVACQQQPRTVEIEAEKKAILQMEEAWLKTVAARDRDAFVSYYAADAVVLEPNKPAIDGKAAITANAAQVFEMPGVSLDFKSTRLEVAQSGDMAWSTGGYSMSAQDQKGNAISDKGKFVTVFRKQADGQWQVVADMYSSDLPLPGPAAAEKK